MARTSQTLQDCQEIHTGLQQRGITPGYRIPRKAWDSIICRLQGTSAAMARTVTLTGELNGLWTVIPGHGPGNGGYVTLLPIPNTTNEILMATPIQPPILLPM